MSEKIVIPLAEEAERVILASLAMYGLQVFEDCRFLRVEMFYTSMRRTIYRVMCELLGKGVTPEVPALIESLTASRELEPLGGVVAVLDACDTLNASRQVAHYVGLVVAAWKRRSGIKISKSYERRFAEEQSVDDTLAQMQSDVFDVMQEKEQFEDPRILTMTTSLLNQTLDYSSSAMGLSYGHRDLNQFTNGMQPAEVTVVGARSGYGKSALATMATLSNAKRGIPVSFFSLEMDKKSVNQRLWSLASGLPFDAIRRKRLNDAQRRVLRRAAFEVGEFPIRVYDNAGMTLPQISAAARLDARVHGTKLIIVDYCQIVSIPGEGKMTIVDRVREVSRSLTALAKGEGVHLMLLSQLRKPLVGQQHHAPTIADLAESRQLENDAHVVILLHRGWDDVNGCPNCDSELIVAKNRNGSPATLKARFNTVTATFDSASHFGIHQVGAVCDDQTA